MFVSHFEKPSSDSWVLCSACISYVTDTVSVFSFLPSGRALQTHPVADIFQEGRRTHSGLCLPQGLLDAAAVEEHVLLLRVAVEVTEDLRRPSKGNSQPRSRLWMSRELRTSPCSGRCCSPSRINHSGIVRDFGESCAGHVIGGKVRLEGV